jgi:hypothetical protein
VNGRDAQFGYIAAFAAFFIFAPLSFYRTRAGVSKTLVKGLLSSACRVVYGLLCGET